MNIILIVIDALRSENLGCYGYDKDTSPNIDRLADQGTKFENCFSCANCTDPSVSTILSGRHPVHHGVMNHGPKYLRENRKSLRKTGTNFLPSVLKNKESRAVDYMEIWTKDEFNRKGLDRSSWKKFKSWIGQKIEGTPLWKPVMKAYGMLFGPSKSGIDCEVTYQRARKDIKQMEKDFFLFIHDWTVHGPYNAPEEMREKFPYKDDDSNRRLEDIGEEGVGPKLQHLSTVKTLGEARSAYDASIYWADKELGKFVEWLKEKGVWEDTFLIVTADHGENLGLSHPLYFQHGYFYDTTVHVPLIIHHPSLPSGNIESIVSHIDIVPTCLDMEDIRYGKKIDGKSLLPLIRGEIDSIRNYTTAAVDNLQMIRNKKYKLIQVPNPARMRNEMWWYDGDGTELFDIREDPKEQNNLAEKMPKKTEEVNKKLEKELQAYRTEREKSKIKESSEQLKNRERE